jgi:hypothetical protein
MGRHLERVFPGLKVYVYLDDFILVARDDKPPPLESVWQEMMQAGFVLGTKKCTPKWTTKLEVLGFVIDTEAMEINITDEKEGQLRGELELLSKTTRAQIRVVARIIGRLQAACLAMRYLAIWLRPMIENLSEALGLHPKELWKDRRRLDIALAYDQEMQVTATTRAVAESLQKFWADIRGRKIKELDPTILIYVDASDQAIGGFVVGVDQPLDQGRSLSEALPPEWIGRSSLARETFALCTILQRFGPLLVNQRALVITDNKGLAARFLRGRAGRRKAGSQSPLLRHASGQASRSLVYDGSLGSRMRRRTDCRGKPHHGRRKLRWNYKSGAIGNPNSAGSNDPTSTCLQGQATRGVRGTARSKLSKDLTSSTDSIGN